MLKHSLIAAATAAIVLALSGCGSASPTAASSPTPTPTPTNPNIQACKDFETASNQLSHLLTDGKRSLSLSGWQQAKLDAVNAMDKAGLSGAGVVQSRINDLVSIVPSDPTDMALTTGRSIGKQYNTGLDRVSNACASEKAAIQLTPLTLAPDFG